MVGCVLLKNSLVVNVDRREFVMKIAGATALVTGANRGFGRALAAELLHRGATVYAGARDPGAVDLPGAIPVALDITDPASIAAAVATVGDLTLLVNNAGSAPAADLLTGDLEVIRSEFEAHVFGTLAVTRAFARSSPTTSAATSRPALP